MRLALPRDTSASEHELLHNSHAASALHRYSNLRADASVNVLVAAANIELGRSRGLVKSSLRRSKRGGATSGESTSDSEVGGSSDEGGDNDILRGGDNLEQDEVYNAGVFLSFAIAYKTRKQENHNYVTFILSLSPKCIILSRLNQVRTRPTRTTCTARGHRTPSSRPKSPTSTSSCPSLDRSAGGAFCFFSF